MPSGLSQVAIVNRALIRIGDQSITAMTDQNPRARTMNAIWAGARDSLLRECPWNFATERDSLSASTTDPEYDWAKAYPVPDDFLYMVATEGNTPYRMEGNDILSNEGTALKITYIKQVTVTTEFDSLFVEALVARLAYEASARLSQDPSTEHRLRQDAELLVIRAKRLNGMEDDPVSYPVDEWVVARGAGGGDVSREPW